MSSVALEKFLRKHRAYFYSEMIRRLGALPTTPYLEFLLNSAQGRRAVSKWIEHTTNILIQDPKDFFAFQRQVGFERAMQGFRLEDVCTVYLTFNEIMWQLIQRARRGEKQISFGEYKKFRDFYEILFQGYTQIAASIISTREDSISEKVTELNSLYEFTKDINTARELKEVIRLILKKMTELFRVEDSLLALARSHRLLEINSHSGTEPEDEIESLMRETFKQNRVLFVDGEGRISDDIDQFELKNAVLIPIRIHKTYYGVLALSDRIKGFRFTKKELSDLYQYFYIIAVSLENIFMLEELKKSRRELQLLTSKIITIREDEQQKLAADIHDTLAQSLAGISYKIQYCKELAKKDSALIVEYLDNLIATVDDTIDRTKLMISSLRPPLFDTMGLIPALERHVRHFIDRTHIDVSTDFPKHIDDLAGDMGICIFRVAQEALTNIYKHAESQRAHISLKVKNGRVVLSICDEGKGFDVSQSSARMMAANTLGLLYMKERVESVGGTRTIKATETGGCCIEVAIPLMNKDK